MNKAFISGRLTRKPELRYTGSEKAVCNLNIANNDKKDEPLFIDCVAWEEQAEACAKYLDKGSKVLIDGSLNIRTWEKDGVKRKTAEIKAHRVEFLDTPNSKTPPDADDGVPF